MPTSSNSNHPSDRLRTRTPTLELGQSSNTPFDSEDERDESVLVGSNSASSGTSIDGRREVVDPSEIQRLLGEGEGEVVRRTRKQRHQWVSILGFTIPRRLLYLLMVPPLFLFFALLTRRLPSTGPTIPTLSNGTDLYHPTTLLISLDGFKPSYLSSHPHLLPHLLALGNSSLGIRAESIQPCFPTQTFPNHWSIMTGLYPESHGIVSNEFWDPERGEEFVYTKEDKSWAGGWWWGEPLWSVAERAGRRTANIMWPGPPTTARRISPSLFIPFRNMEATQKLDQVFEWLDMPIHSRPQLITTYIPDVDSMGHWGGPESDKVEQALKVVDDFIGGVVGRLALRNLSEIVNLLVVSDHGMASTANERLIFLDQVLGEQACNDIAHRDGWPSVGLRFKEGAPVDDYLQLLLDAAENSEGFDIYTHETMPERWHFNSTTRIAPILMVPKLGWAITDDHEHKVIHKGDYQPKGNHGYDNIEPDMQAIFFAHGPFAKSLKAASTGHANRTKRGWVSTNPHIMQSFSNLEIFSLVIRLMDLQDFEPAHNGTIGFWDDYLDPT